MHTDLITEIHTQLDLLQNQLRTLQTEKIYLQHVLEEKAPQTAKLLQRLETLKQDASITADLIDKVGAAIAAHYGHAYKAAAKKMHRAMAEAILPQLYPIVLTHILEEEEGNG